MKIMNSYAYLHPPPLPPPRLKDDTMNFGADLYNSGIHVTIWCNSYI